ncbi:MAG: BLUF domain-containing protein [Burkholderiales bacterium]
MSVRLIYASKACDLQPTDLIDILHRSQHNNLEFEITGALSFFNNIFMQCLEGKNSNVNATYSRIMRDKRHTQLTLLSFEEISQRQFGIWSMGLVDTITHEHPLFQKYGKEKEFDPFKFNMEETRHFFAALQKETTLFV